MPRYVILLHETPPGFPRPTHYDLMLEWGESLRTWAIAEPPFVGCDLPALLLPDHRLAYLDYEGPVSNDRGVVSRWDAGKYQSIQQSPFDWDVELQGVRLRGHLKLIAAGAETNDWRISFSNSPTSHSP